MQMEEQKSRRSRQSATLTQTLTIAFVLVSVLPLLLVGSFQTFRNFQARREAIANQQRLIANDAANSVASFVEAEFSTLRALAQTSDVSPDMAEEQREILDNLLSLQPAFREALLLDATGQTLAKASKHSVVTSADLTDLSESELFKQVSQDQRYISSVHIDETTNEPLVTLAVPVKNVFGELEGVLVAQVNLKFMWDLVGSLTIGDEGLAYVVDRQGNLLAFRDTSRVLSGENLGYLDEVAKFIKGQAISDEMAGALSSSGIDGTNVLAASAPLGTPDWAVVVELPVTEAYASIFQDLLISATVILISIIVAGAAGIYLARRLAAPLLDLSQTASRIAGGELELTASARGTAEVNQLAAAFNSMTTQLRVFIQSLERRVQERTQALNTGSEVSRSLSTILDLNELVNEVVNQVQAAFNYYHVHIYLLDDTGQTLTMAGGTGSAGEKMLADGHQIKVGQGLVGRAAADNTTLLVPDVTQEEGWMPNPLLPETKAETAVSIASGEQVLGVLDVQQDATNGLGQADVDLLQTISNQVAIALRNSRLYAELQQQAQREARINEINQKILETTDVKSAMQVAIRELGRATGASETGIYLDIGEKGNGRSHTS